MRTNKKNILESIKNKDLMTKSKNKTWNFIDSQINPEHPNPSKLDPSMLPKKKHKIKAPKLYETLKQNPDSQ